MLQKAEELTNDLRERNRTYQLKSEESSEVIAQLEQENQQVKVTYEKQIEENHCIIVDMKNREAKLKDENQRLTGQVQSLEKQVKYKDEELQQSREFSKSVLSQK